MEGSLSLVIDIRHNFVTIFFSNLYLFDSFFSVIVWTDKFHDFDEGIYFPDNCCYGNGQKTFLQCITSLAETSSMLKTSIKF